MQQALRTLPPRASAANRWLILASCFLIVVGARLWMIAIYGSALPMHDQWDAEAAYLFKPWLEGHLTWKDLFSPHNEHRIVLSRLLALGLLRLNGQWDGQLEMAANAVLCGILSLCVVGAAERFFTRRGPVYLALAIVLWLALPYGQENTLWGFQSSFYFLLIFSLGAICGLGFHRALSFPWWLGALSAVLACFTLASGFFATAIVVTLVVIRFIKHRAWSLEQTITAFLATAILAVGFYLRTEFLPHAALKAISPQAWINVFARSLGWPFCDSVAAAALLYWPFCWLAVHWLKSARTEVVEGEAERREIEILLAVGLWVILQAAAIAYSRGRTGSDPIASRYMDVLALGALVNVGSATILLRTLPRGKSLVLTSSIWIAAVTAGAGWVSYKQLSSQIGRQAWLQTAEQNLRAYVATGDSKYLDGDPPPNLPYPDGWRLATLLSDPSLRPILPAAIRPALQLEAKSDENNAFIVGGYPPEVINPPYERSWGSYSFQGPAARGTMETFGFAPRLSYLQIELAGFLREGMTLELRAVTGVKHARFIPTTRIDANWRSGIVPVPASRVDIVARDDNPGDWFAFRQPREVGRFSYYASRVIAKGKLLLLLGLICFSAAFVQLVLNGITNRRKT